MDEEEVKETEADETSEEENGGDDATTEEVEQEQDVEEHDWGELENRISGIEEKLNSLTEAFATLSVANEDGAESDPVHDVDEEYGEALDLDGMLGL